MEVLAMKNFVTIPGLWNYFPTFDFSGCDPCIDQKMAQLSTRYVRSTGPVSIPGMPSVQILFSEIGGCSQIPSSPC